MLLNARCLRDKLTDFQPSIYSNDVDILVITETWLKPAILDREVLPSGYSVYSRYRENDRRSGGVLITIKDSIPTIRRRDIETNCELCGCRSQSDKSKEALYLWLLSYPVD